ncbi:MAG: hypothetical protein A3F54_04410 [Candidatus Kerfeldbacteria bacterium RIFCSPHIGHO2_12_FULL_48_17]|uniref:Uncharacterized protein n=1 Tax=Candidatus Kerfeldbacteria bacterium RIFCSPHIGHO2_12_FULL_48_17 TaxID=1798542 RepID=A0A1G2B961_9BACT|nr:MAG: hypothetical protein A3F54_04410 [Candidatus Kerfeldbacteria bacterium RIFCSPHIGHO2_12_FULL_48_17]
MFDYQNEAHLLRRIQLLRSRVIRRSLLQDVAVNSTQQALMRGVAVVQRLLVELPVINARAAAIEPGFSRAHIARLYANALILCSGVGVFTPAERFIGLVAGPLHKMGLAITDRYHEKDRLVGYAEVSGLLVSDCFYGCGLGNHAERDLIAYAIAAQTHYNAKSFPPDARRRVPPYDDVFSGLPFWIVWIPRWCNRLECVGPGFVVRHLLSRAKSLQPGHVDYMKDGFYDSAFALHMVPSLDPAAGHTMVRHLENFRATQVNSSAYGKHDCGVMLDLRERQKERTARIIAATQKPRVFSSPEEEDVLRIFGQFMVMLDGSDGTPGAVSRIFAAFRELPQTTRHAWLAGFLQAMQEYVDWSEQMRERLQAMPAEWLHLPGICDSITDYFRPDPEWCRLLQKYDWTF